jgi:hypothetical protein
MKSIFLVIGFSLCSALASAQAEAAEPNLKAAFIYNFTKYIGWDTSSAEREFVIGVLGTSPVTGYLMQIAKTNTVKNRKINIRYFTKPEEIKGCHMLFIPGSTTYSLSSILAYAGKNILTISEQPGYAKQGTALNFVIVNDKLKFEANIKTIYAAGLNASSQLLKLAIIIN